MNSMQGFDRFMVEPDNSSCFFAIVDPASGGSDDWSKGVAGIKFVYLLELRPEENVDDGFILSADELVPTARETLEGVKTVARAVIERAGITLIDRARASRDAVSS